MARPDQSYLIAADSQVKDTFKITIRDTYFLLNSNTYNRKKEKTTIFNPLERFIAICNN